MKKLLLLILLGMLAFKVQSQTYCTSSGNASISPSTYVGNVVFNTINWNAGQTGIGYSDNTSTYSTNVSTGSLYDIQVMISTGNGNTAYANAFIDWNQNGSFTDAGETYALGSSTNNQATVLTSACPLNITVPSNAAIGTTRMRITVELTSTIGSCDNNMAGQVQDYGIVVSCTPNSLSGIVTISSSSVSTGQVFLNKQRVSTNVVDTTTLLANIVNGAYTYTNLPVGNYYLKAIANAISYPNAIPTYYSTKTNNYIWDSAIVISHTGCTGINNSGYNISVLSITTQTGTGIISGNVSVDSTFGMRLSHSGNNHNVMGAPIKGIDVKLGRNPGGACARTTTTDNSGNYAFTNVDTGSYFVYVDIPNFKDTIANVNVSAANLSNTNINYCIDSTKIHFCGMIAAGINKLVGVSNDANIYPNPSNGIFTIETNSNMPQAINVFDVNGKIVFSQCVRGKANIDANGLNDGVYNISITSNESAINKRLIILR